MYDIVCNFVSKLLKLFKMKKRTGIYVDVELISKLEQLANKEDRSFNWVAERVLKKGLSEEGVFIAKPSGDLFELPEDILSEVKEFAVKEDRPTEQMITILVLQALREKKRLREKYLKSLEKKQ